MPLYNINNKILEPIKKEDFPLEKDLQRLTENNLKELFNLKFVSTEFQVGDLRIDTLAYNEEFNSFVIIEYKNNKNYSLIDQGFSYLSLLLDNKAEFVLEYNQRFKTNKSKKDIDFSQSKIMFISPAYTKYQLKSSNFKDPSFELWKVSKFSNNTVLYDKIITDGKHSIKEIQGKNNIIDKVEKEIIVYDEDHHLKNKNDEIKELYYFFKESVQNEFDDIEILPFKTYISFKYNGDNIVSIIPLIKNIKICFNMKKGTLNDYLKKTEDVSNKGHNGTGDYIFYVENINDVKYSFELFKEVYDYKS